MRTSAATSLLLSACLLMGCGRGQQSDSPSGHIKEAGFSQAIDKPKLDAYFDALEANNKFMGSVAISQDEKILYTRSTGFSDIEGNKKPDENTKYRIGSISKTFTAVLIFKTIEEKKLSLTQTLDKYFPAIKNASKITISNLLNHRSGIHNFTNDPEYQTYYTQKKTQQEMVEIITRAGSDFEPDSKAEYSNSAFVLLSYILEKIYAKSPTRVQSPTNGGTCLSICAGWYCIRVQSRKEPNDVKATGTGFFFRERINEFSLAGKRVVHSPPLSESLGLSES